MRGKLIVIEGTDCSGKETQSKMLAEKLNKENIKTTIFSFPCYDSPTGKIVGGPYLGKEYITTGWFKETAPQVDPKVSSLYFAADRKYNIGKVLELIEKGENVILDRYFYSNMGHQAGKLKNKAERFEMYKWIEKLEVELLGLPIPDIKIFIHMPYETSLKIRENRAEAFDENELDSEHLIQAERSYFEIADLYGFETIECVEGEKLLTINEINEIIYKYLKENLSK